MVQEDFGSDSSILPAQFFSRRPDVPQSLTKFAYAMLQGALDDLNYKGLVPYRRYSRQRVATEARLWFSSPSRYPGSFIWTCEILGVRPHLMRARLR